MERRYFRCKIKGIDGEKSHHKKKMNSTKLWNALPDSARAGYIACMLFSLMSAAADMVIFFLLTNDQLKDKIILAAAYALTAIAKITNIYTINIMPGIIAAQLTKSILKSLQNASASELQKLPALATQKMDIVESYMIRSSVEALGSIVNVVLLAGSIVIVIPRKYLAFPMLAVGIYVVLAALSNQIYKRMGRRILDFLARFNKYINYMSNIDIILSLRASKEIDTSLDQLYLADDKRRRLTGLSVAIGQSPRYIIEVIVITVVLLYTKIIGMKLDLSGQTLPGIVFAVYRIFTTAQNGFASYSNTRLGHLAFEEYRDFVKETMSSEDNCKRTWKYNRSGRCVLNTRIVGIDLVSRAQQRIYVSGSSGCGKSSLLRHIAEEIMEGKDQISIQTNDTNYMIHVGKCDKFVFLPQEVVIPDVQIWEYLNWPCNSFDSNEMLDLIEKYIGNISMTHDIVKRRVTQLSGGQRRSLMIAKALSTPATIYIFDEPLNGIDRKRQKIMLSIIEQEMESANIIYTSHETWGRKWSTTEISLES